MTPRSPRTIYLVDDNPEFRASAQWWLSGAGYDVQDYGDAEDALQDLRQLAQHTPERLRRACLLLDVRMPGLSGLDLHDRLAECGLTLRPQHGFADGYAEPGDGAAALPVVYMTGHGDVPLAVAAMQKGAITMLEKPFVGPALEQALERAFAAAESAWARAQAAAVFDDDAAPAGPGREPGAGAPAPDAADRLEFARRLESLSPRQRQIMDGIVAGKLSKQIAYEMGLSAKTVEFHRKYVMEKMRARTAVELVRMAVSRSVAAMS